MGSTLLAAAGTRHLQTCRVDKQFAGFHDFVMKLGLSNTTTAKDALADQQAGDDGASAEKRAADHVRQIQSLAQAAVQAMVTSRRNK